MLDGIPFRHLLGVVCAGSSDTALVIVGAVAIFDRLHIASLAVSCADAGTDLACRTVRTSGLPLSPPGLLLQVGVEALECRVFFRHAEFIGLRLERVPNVEWVFSGVENHADHGKMFELSLRDHRRFLISARSVGVDARRNAYEAGGTNVAETFVFQFFSPFF